MADIKNPERRGFEPSGQEPDEGSASRMKEQAREAAGEAGDKAREAVATVRDRVSHQAHDIAHKGKHRAAEAISDIATSIREAGHKLHEEEQEGPARYVDKTADQIDSVARYLEEHDVEQLVDTVEDAARKQPAIFLGIAFATGILAARFVRSSAKRAHRQASGNQYGGASRPGSSYSPYATTGAEESFLASETEPEPGGVEGFSGSATRTPGQPARQEDVKPTPSTGDTFGPTSPPEGGDRP